MSHMSEDRLVDLALGASPDVTEHDHLTSCVPCTNTHSGLLDTVSVTRRAGPELLVSPPPRVWDAIRTQIDTHVDPHSETRFDTRGHSEVRSERQPELRSESSSAPVTRIDARRARRSRMPTAWLLAAACVLGIVLGVGGATVASLLGREPAPSELTVASASLAPLDSPQTMGVASLLDRDDGLRLEVPDLGLDPGEGFLEVWLINRDLTRMISIGVVPVDATGVVLPVSQRLIDEGYVIVDISREPFDDQPAHSGDTLVRGELSI